MIRVVIRAAMLSLALTSVAGAASAQTAASVHAGTLGVGVEVKAALGPSVVVRGGIDRLRRDFDQTYSGVDYGAELDFDTVGAFIDLHPFRNAWFVSGGAYLGARELRLEAEPVTPVEIGGAMFTPGQVGKLSGAVALPEATPFVGMGFDNTFTGRWRVGVRALIGAAVGESPDVTLNSQGGTLSGSAAFRQRLDAEAERIRDEADFSLYPVAQIGLSYRF
ncbi:MAG: hypothetical protein J0M36_06230 [Caulobacterales bacterium]|nr:hypothetical protein [Caulobacterales bacterium]